MCNVIFVKNVRIQLPLNDKSIFCDWIKTVPAAQVPDILGSKMGYRAIKTSESETNFYRRCLNSEQSPAAAPGSPHIEFCPPGFPVSGGRRGTSFEVEAVFSTCGYHLRLSGLVFVTRCWHYLTISDYIWIYLIVYCNSKTFWWINEWMNRARYRGAFAPKNTIICGKSPKGGEGSGPKSKKSTFQM